MANLSEAITEAPLLIGNVVIKILIKALLPLYSLILSMQIIIMELHIIIIKQTLCYLNLLSMVIQSIRFLGINIVALLLLISTMSM